MPDIRLSIGGWTVEVRDAQTNESVGFAAPDGEG
jgi:hypothetical protein